VIVVTAPGERADEEEEEAPDDVGLPITFFFCIMMLEVLQKRSGMSRKWNSLVDQRMRSSAHFAIE